MVGSAQRRAAVRRLTLVFMMRGIGRLIPVMIAYNAYWYAVSAGRLQPNALRLR
jgi:cytochrome bd-type quinol oxidase subunit 2